MSVLNNTKPLEIGPNVPAAGRSTGVDDLTCAHRLDLGPPPALITAYRAVLKSVATQHDLILIDGPRYFKQKGASNREFYDQVHPSQTGHQWLGEALSQAIKPYRKYE